jgi:cellulose biosynthesis protein BcsQ
MAKPVVIVVGADKGGVGKTTVSRTLLDYFDANSIPTRGLRYRISARYAETLSS